MRRSSDNVCIGDDGDCSGGVWEGHSTNVWPLGLDTVITDIVICRCDGDGGIPNCCPDDLAWNLACRVIGNADSAPPTFGCATGTE